MKKFAIATFAVFVLMLALPAVATAPIFVDNPFVALRLQVDPKPARSPYIWPLNRDAPTVEK